jgi:M6 family metalloprotease-like protein
MTWGDYRPIPRTSWADTNRHGSERQVRVALVVADFPDQPFVITLPAGSDLFGNPRASPVPRDRVARFYRDFYATPSALNHGHTVHEYWMEQSRGRVGVSITAFGPYRMPSPSFVYGLPQSAMPAGHTAAPESAQEQLDSLWRADRGRVVADSFDLVLRILAGYDETGTWQEFGEMKFAGREHIPPEWGNPDRAQPRWVESRFGAWTSWKAAQWIWSNSAIVQGESVNTVRHELAHALFLIEDNYNNPFAEPRRRAPAGPWDLMDRGAFNGPGGPHSRWHVPPVSGGSMSSGLMLRQRLRFGFVDSAQVLMLDRDGLARSGLAIAEVTARSAAPLPGTKAGMHVRLGEDRSPHVDPARDATSSGIPDFDFYTVEVVQRIGYDSFTPDEGVLIAKNKDRARPVGGPNGFDAHTWTIDANAADVRVPDFIRPGGEVVMRSMADYRQLNDALFHAGNNSGSSFEWVDTHNRLHFYVLDVRRDAADVLRYALAVRSLDGAGPHGRGITLSAPRTSADSVIVFSLANTGRASSLDRGMHPGASDELFSHDVYRLRVTVRGDGWSAGLRNALTAVPFGEVAGVPVFVRHARGASATATVVLTATSESDPRRRADATFTVSRSFR